VPLNPSPTETAAPATGPAQPRGVWRVPALLLAFWAYAVYRLGTLWNANVDYHYGWFVPVLCLALFWDRWPSRPPPSSPPSLRSAGLLFAAFNGLLAAGAIFLDTLPNWRFAGWVFALAVVGLTLMVVYFWGGPKWVFHFAFPILFFLVAVPWPLRFEAPFIDQLSRLNAIISAALANLLGTPCVRQGTLIATGGGLVGVEAACSGIRSLQSTIMISLFLGELFRYQLSRRVAMVMGGLSLAFGGNVVRTLYLVWICDRQGNAGVDQQHDEAGLAILGVTLIGLLGLAWVLNLPQKTTARKDPKPISSPVAPANLGPYGLRMMGGLLLWVVLFESGLELWFRRVEQRASQTVPWTLVLPNSAREFVEKPIPATTRNMLMYDEGHNAAWLDAAGRPWQLYYFRWLPAANRYRAAEATGAARSHAPDLCLKNVGMILQTNLGTKIIEQRGVRMWTTTERFLDHQRNFHVLAAYWEPRETALTLGPQGQPSTALGLSMALYALSHQDRGREEKRVVKIGVWDMLDDAAAQTALENCLREAITESAPAP